MAKLLIAFSLFLLGCQSLGFIDKKYEIDVQGHRGARSVRPENTIPAFKEALEAGVDTIELDLAVTKDNVVVSSHDLLISPVICTGPKGQKLTSGVAIRALSLKELKKYDCGRLKNPRFPKQIPVPNTRIPTLDEIFKFVSTSGIVGSEKVMFNIETKIVPAKPELTPTPKQYIDLIMKVVKKYKVESRVVIQSFDHRTLRYVKKKYPEIKTSALIAGSLPNLVLLAKDLKAEYISPYFMFINKEVVKELQANNIKVVPWTINKKEDWKMMLDFGVDGIITDDPRALIDYLNELNKDKK